MPRVYLDVRHAKAAPLKVAPKFVLPLLASSAVNLGLAVVFLNDHEVAQLHPRIREQGLLRRKQKVAVQIWGATFKGAACPQR